MRRGIFALLLMILATSVFGTVSNPSDYARYKTGVQIDGNLKQGNAATDTAWLAGKVYIRATGSFVDSAAMNLLSTLSVTGIANLYDLLYIHTGIVDTGYIKILGSTRTGNAATDSFFNVGKFYQSATGWFTDSSWGTFLKSITVTDSIFSNYGDIDSLVGGLARLSGSLKVTGTTNHYGAVYFSLANGLVDSGAATIGRITTDYITSDTLTDGTMSIIAGNLTAVKRITADYLNVDTLLAPFGSGRSDGWDRLTGDTLTDGTMSIIGGNLTGVGRITADYVSLDTLTAPNGATIMNDYSDTLSITETNVKINGKLNSSGDVVFKGGGVVGDSFGDTYLVSGWLDWNNWKEVNPATHGELVRAACKMITGATGTQFQAGFFATQNKYSMPEHYINGGLEGKATASAPNGKIRGLRGGTVCKDSGDVEIMIGVNGYNECLSGATADTAVKLLLDDIAWAGTVTVDYGILHRTLNTIDCGIYHDGTFTADFGSSDGVFNCAGISGTTLEASSFITGSAYSRGTTTFATGTTRKAINIVGVTASTYSVASWVADPDSAALSLSVVSGIATVCKTDSLIINIALTDTFQARVRGLNYMIMK